MTLRLAPKGVNFTFYQIAPGSERQVERDFVGNSAVSAGARKEFFKALGRFDLVVVEEIEEALTDSDPAENHLLLADYVLSAQSALGGGWILENLPQIWDKVDEFPLVGISFLKLSPYLLARYGPTLVDRFIVTLLSTNPTLPGSRWLGRKTPCFTVYATIGYNELLVLFFSKLDIGFQPILADIFQLRSLRPSDIGLEGRGNLLVDTHTIPAIRYQALSQLLSISEDAGEDRVVSEPSMDATISIATLAGFEDDAARVLEKYLSRPSATLGEFDLRVRANLTLSRALTSVLKVRRQTGTSIISTSTDLEFDRPESHPAELREELRYEPVQLDRDLECILRTDTQLHRSLISLLGAINSRFARYDLADAYSDLSPFVRDFVGNKYGGQDIDEQDLPRLWKLTELLATGFRQRSCGIMLSPYVSSDVAVGFKGSANAVLRAAGAIPLAMLRALGAEWKGFIIFGMGAGYKRYDFGIMNLPFSYILDPSRWWGLFHEVGHELGWQRSVTDRDPQTLRDLEGWYRDKNGEPLRDELYIHELMWEHYSDLVDFVVGFRCQWRLYAETVMPYLLGEFASGVDDYMTRLVGVWYCYHHFWQGSQQTGLPVDAISHLVSGFLTEVESACNSVGRMGSDDWREEWVPKLIRYLSAWKPYLEYAAKDLAAIVPKPIESPIRGADLVLEGRVADALQDPVGLVVELLRYRQRIGEDKWQKDSFPIRMAAIQSLNLFVLRQTRDTALVRLQARTTVE